MTLGLLGLYVLVTTVWAVWHKSLPQAEWMGSVGLLALVANSAVALLLYRFRAGDANMRSVWICSRNDAIGNVAVVLAAAGVFGTGTADRQSVGKGKSWSGRVDPGGGRIITKKRKKDKRQSVNDRQRTANTNKH